MFRKVSLSIIRSFFHCTHSNCICHTDLLTACEQDQDGTTVPPSKVRLNGYSCKSLIKFKYSTEFKKKEIWDFIKILPIEADLFHV